MGLTCGGQKTADADHNRSRGERNSAHGSHNCTRGERNKLHTGHNDQVEQDISSLTEEVRLNQTENRSHFKHVESELEQQQQTFQVVADETKSVKSILAI
jgi:hypothetical protein